MPGHKTRHPEKYKRQFARTGANKQRRDDAEITVLRLCRRLKIDLPISAADAQRIREAEIRAGRTMLPDEEVKTNTLYQRVYRARKKSQGKQ